MFDDACAVSVSLQQQQQHKESFLGRDATSPVDHDDDGCDWLLENELLYNGHRSHGGDRQLDGHNHDTEIHLPELQDNSNAPLSQPDIDINSGHLQRSDHSDVSDFSPGTAGSGRPSLSTNTSASTWTTPALSLADDFEPAKHFSAQQILESDLLSSHRQLQWSNEIPDSEAAHHLFFPEDITPLEFTSDGAFRNHIHNLHLHLNPPASHNLRRWLALTPRSRSKPRKSSPRYKNNDTATKSRAEPTTISTNRPAISQFCPPPTSPPRVARPSQKPYFFVDNSDKKTACRLRNAITSRRARQRKIAKIARVRELEASCSGVQG